MDERPKRKPADLGAIPIISAIVFGLAGVAWLVVGISDTDLRVFHLVLGLLFAVCAVGWVWVWRRGRKRA